MIIGLTNLIATLFAMAVIDKVGRKTLLLWLWAETKGKTLEQSSGSIESLECPG